ncbi:hypothetical protein HDU76_008691, partial [Blyttiomyces sp. JEL0837]
YSKEVRLEIERLLDVLDPDSSRLPRPPPVPKHSWPVAWATHIISFLTSFFQAVVTSMATLEIRNITRKYSSVSLGLGGALLYWTAILAGACVVLHSLNLYLLWIGWRKELRKEEEVELPPDDIKDIQEQSSLATSVSISSVNNSTAEQWYISSVATTGFSVQNVQTWKGKLFLQTIGLVGYVNIGLIILLGSRIILKHLRMFTLKTLMRFQKERERRGLLKAKENEEHQRESSFTQLTAVFNRRAMSETAYDVPLCKSNVQPPAACPPPSPDGNGTSQPTSELQRRPSQLGRSAPSLISTISNDKFKNHNLTPNSAFLLPMNRTGSGAVLKGTKVDNKVSPLPPQPSVQASAVMEEDSRKNNVLIHVSGGEDDANSSGSFSFSRPFGQAVSEFFSMQNFSLQNVRSRFGMGSSTDSLTREKTIVESLEEQLDIITAVAIIIFIWIGGGVVFFLTESWSFVDGTYFMFSILTTTGYGDLYPSSPGGRIAVYIFSFLGIGIWAFVLTVLVNKLQTFSTSIHFWKKVSGGKPGLHIKKENKGIIEEPEDKDEEDSDG